MYLSHFGITKSPFSLTPDPRFLFFTSKHREAYAALMFAVLQRKGMLVLTGEAGTGKTILLRKMLLSMPATSANFSVIVNPLLTSSELLESVLLNFGMRDVPSSKALRLSCFKQLLLRANAESKTSVLVIDEAHLLTASLLEEVRLLSNFETSEQKLLQIILAGQKELNETLELESTRQIKQRVALRVHIEPLLDQDVRDYIRTRWARSGSSRTLPFSSDAIDIIATASGGIPRVVNAICDAALVNAYGSGIEWIGAPEIEEVLTDLKISLPKRVNRSYVAPVSDVPLPSRSETVGERAPVLSAPQAHRNGTSRTQRLFRIANWFGAARHPRAAAYKVH